MSAPAIRILCVDDHRLVREGVAYVIDRQPGLRVVGLAATADEAVDLYRQLRPDVVLMDLQLGQTSGLEAIRQIRTHDPCARIIVLTVHQGEEDIFRSLQAGAATYLLKDTPFEELARMINEVYAGRRPVTREVEARLVARAGRPAVTPREVEVLELLSQGMRDKEIAVALGISTGTAQVHVKNILAKLDVDDRSGAINVALRRGIIHLT